MILKETIDAMGATFPIAMITMYALFLYGAAMYYTRNLDRPESPKKALPPSGKRRRPAAAHKAS